MAGLRRHPLTIFHLASLYSADFEVGPGAVKGALRLPLACVLSHHTSGGE
jgi:hypothetical protein